MKNNILVIGCGRWGTFIAWYLHSLKNQVTLYGRESSKNMQQLIKYQCNDYLTLDSEIELTTSLQNIDNYSIIAISINSQNLRTLGEQLASYNLKNKIVILCMKGIENTTGKRLSTIIEETIDASNQVLVWLGPGHVEEYYKGIPNCMVIDGKHEQAKEYIVHEFSSSLIRFYYGTDLIGNEIGAATKNVIGIAAGILDGLHYSSLKGALMARGTREISKLIEVLGGRPSSAYGLCHLGDYGATVFSEYSKNCEFGLNIVNGIKPARYPEGYATAKALILLKKQYNIELPICEAVYNILYNNQPAKTTLDNLFTRSLKKEF